MNILKGIPITQDIKPLALSEGAIEHRAAPQENALTKALQAHTPAQEAAQLKQQESWKAHSVIRIQGKISAINFYDHGVELHGGGTKSAPAIDNAMAEGEALGLSGKALDDLVTNRLLQDLKKRYGGAVSVERYNAASAPTAAALQTEMYGKTYLQQHPPSQTLTTQRLQMNSQSYLTLLQAKSS